VQHHFLTFPANNNTLQQQQQQQQSMQAELITK
jgi:hypothetical protein